MYFRKTYLLFILVIQSGFLSGQQPDIFPLSIWINNPIVLNPAITGSKDFMSVDLVAATGEGYNSQVITSNARIRKKIKGYLSSPGYSGFSAFGTGGYIYNHLSDLYRTTGIGVSGAYHLVLGSKSNSIISFGLAATGRYYVNNAESGFGAGTGVPDSKLYEANIDAGIYYYGQSLYIGLSSTNITGPTWGNSNNGLYTPEERHYYLMGGYKYIISSSMDIIIEPSAIISASESTIGDITSNIDPMISIYFENFCTGSYFYDKEKLAFFFIYNYPRFRLGAFIAIPKNTSYIKEDLAVEVSAGINLSSRRSGRGRRYHW